MALVTFTIEQIKDKLITPFVFGTHSSEVALWFEQYTQGGNDGIVALNAAGRSSLKRALRTKSGLAFRTKELPARKRKDGTKGKASLLKLTPNTQEANEALTALGITINEIANMPTDKGYKVLQLVK